MRKRSRILFALAVVAVVGAIAWLALRPKVQEPVYGGKPLSVWLESYNSSDTVALEQLHEAIRHIGTNTIPLLLRRLQAKDSPLMLKLVALARKQHIFPVKFTEAEILQEQACFGFVALGEDGRDAVPELIKIYNKRGSSNTVYSVTLALAYIGPEAKQAVPSLLRSLDEADDAERAAAALALGNIRADPQLVVPALMKCLTDKEGLDNQSAIYALSRFGADAKAAVPLLIKLLNDSDQYVRDAAKDALKAIDPEAAAKAGVQ